ncbi:aminotransferase-like domain-containing protein [Anaeromyxobacter oryzae]|uniref:GntR family transcriptional regulator n=1 Tax=Anaeromyxobacter oryzae TaxID=2918170 RepID=A0ABN6MNC5_9BACT|nr:PLP-dependent aminotransferase family protein [Anaeromyxobacter oryzae]BDG02480.1 GntR family transcriptional regulator [Anaeromyxobacter oryzae]
MRAAPADAQDGQEAIPVDAAGGCPGLPGLVVDRQSGVRFPEQISRGITALVEQGRVRAGTRLPSVRDLARALGVSTFTVVEAYDQLVATRTASARRGSGTFVMHLGAGRGAPDAQPQPIPATVGENWLSFELFAQQRNLSAAGCGWLPAEWCGESYLTEALRQAARIPNERLAGYGTPLGFLPLRQRLALRLSEQLGHTAAEQIILTSGATHALDLVIRTLLSPGDAVLVESPGYCNLIPLLRERGCRLLAVPRTARGLSIDALNLLAAEHRPKAMFVTTALQNPLSTTLSQVDAHCVLAAAERYDFMVVEDDIFRDFCAAGDASLAALDGLKRVLKIGSFSKSVSPSLRVGYVACPQHLVQPLVRAKMLCGLTTSEVNERCVHEVLGSGGHRRYLERLHTKLTAARERFLGTLESLGLAPLATPAGGMFVSAGWPVRPTVVASARLIADEALKARIALAPGDFFEVGTPETIWFRFNVAYSDDPRLHAFLRDVRTRFGF